MASRRPVTLLGGTLSEIPIGDVIPVSAGGTGATTAAAARTALGAGTSNFSGSWNDLTSKPAVIGAGENAAAARLAIGAARKNYRETAGGTDNTAGYYGWCCIGTVQLGQSATAKLSIQGTSSYSDGTQCSGESVIYLRGTNLSSSIGYDGYFFGFSNESATLAQVAVSWAGGGVITVYVKPAGPYTAMNVVCETSGIYTPDFYETGATTQPSGTVLLPSKYTLQINGSPALIVNSSGAQVNGSIYGTRGIKAGDQAPTIKQKLITGTIPATGGYYQVSAHGLSSAKIVSATVVAITSDGNVFPSGRSDDPSVFFNFWLSSSSVCIHLESTATAVLGQAFSCLITYTE